MAVLVPDHRFVLLPALGMLMILANIATSQFVPPVNVTVSIKSEMGEATKLSVHCGAYWGGPPNPVIDLDEHRLANDEIYRFSFLEDMSTPLEHRRVYMCECRAVGYPVHEFYVYHPHLCKCVDGKCALRMVKPEGFFCGGERVGTWRKSA